MIATSFRVRLSLWNVGVLAAVLLVAGLLLGFGIQNGIRATVDRELMLRAQRAAHGGPIRPPFGPGGGPQNPDPNAEPQFQDPEGGPPPEGPGGLPFNGVPGGGAPNDGIPGGGGLPGDGPPGPGAPGRGFMNYRKPALPRGQFAALQMGGTGLADGEGSSNVGPSSSLPSNFEAERAALFMRAHFIAPDGPRPGAPADRRPWDERTVADAAQGNIRFSTTTGSGERVRVLSVPWIRNGQIIGVVQVARPLGEFDRLRDGQFHTLLMLCPVALLIAGMGALLLTERALKPVREVTVAAAQISAEDLSARLEVRGEDELAQLAHTFNGMIGRLEASFEQQRRFTSDASHELRTPLARIKVTTSEALDGEHTPDEYRKALQIADRAADTMGRLVEQLLLLARGDGGQLRVRSERVDLGYVMADTAEHFDRTEGPSVEVRLPNPPIAALGDPDWIACILKNLTENAVRHTPREGHVSLSADTQGGWVTLRVLDTGEGISPEHLPHLTDRFYRVDAARSRNSKGSRGGTGLGLAITRMLVEAHQGRLEFASEPGRGTQVTVVLPAAQS